MRQPSIRLVSLVLENKRRSSALDFLLVWPHTQRMLPYFGGTLGQKGHTAELWSRRSSIIHSIGHSFYRHRAGTEVVRLVLYWAPQSFEAMSKQGLSRCICSRAKVGPDLIRRRIDRVGGRPGTCCQLCHAAPLPPSLVGAMTRNGLFIAAYPISLHPVSNRNRIRNRIDCFSTRRSTFDFFFKGDYDVLDFNGWNRVYPDFDRLFRLCWVWFRC